MENNVNSVPDKVQPVFRRSHIPKLSRLVIVKLAECVENDTLPPFGSPLPPCYSNEIVEILRAKKALNTYALRIMHLHRFQITKIDFTGNKISYDHLQYCHQHNLKTFRLGDMDYLPNTNKIQVATVLSTALNSKSRRELRHLDLSGRLRMTSSWPQYVAKHLPNLEGLVFANRSTANDTLSQIGANLCNLRFLDISNTCVTDISCISGMKNLEVLIMYNLNILKGDVTDTLSNLTKLRVLDISRKANTDYLQETSQDAHLDLALGIYNRSLKALELKLPTPWKELRAIDMSGLSLVQFGADVALEFVNQIIEAHPKLEQIALLATPLDSQSIEYPGRYLNVINTSSRKSVLATLQHYANLDRAAFTAHALHSVYYLLQSGYDKFTQEELEDCLRLVCLSMQRYLSTLAVQIAGSACLYHLCKMKRIKRMSVKEVCNCIERSLDAAEYYRSMTQLQKNVWLTICNDYLLHLEGVDFYRTCKVALETMISNRDASVERMTIAIVSIVTPKMRPSDAQSLTLDDKYVKHLVKIMQDYLDTYNRENRRGQVRENDNTLYTLKFTLSALWNLTDECTETCSVFLESGGVEVAFQILNVFSTHSNVQTKVLGILNNVAELRSVKTSILYIPEHISMIIDCLEGNFDEKDVKGRHRDVERSYFAAGILANLLIGEESWESAETKSIVSERLLEAVDQWPQLPSAMVSYRSFVPFGRIIEESNSNGAIMWCLWGIHHVLRHRDATNAPHCEKGYVHMLIQDEVYFICEKIARCQFKKCKLDNRVIQIAREIVDIVDIDVQN